MKSSSTRYVAKDCSQCDRASPGTEIALRSVASRNVTGVSCGKLVTYSVVFRKVRGVSLRSWRSGLIMEIQPLKTMEFLMFPMV